MTLPYQALQPKRQQQTRSSSSTNLSVLKGLPFWIWDKQQHTEEYIRTGGQCCFNHVVGLPVKDKIEHPIYDYEKILYDTLMQGHNSVVPSYDFKNKHLWVKKATGLLNSC